MMGDPRAASLQSATSEDGPLCGLVDVFDFPLNPPEGDGVARGGGDYGIYRGRYEKYHAGEDWWMTPWRSTLGTPVHSVGHGRVTYAAPLGWGRDQGVDIVQHTFTDGRHMLSFYGHLDPDSVILSRGDCVRRGEQVGKIGRPTTGPHLHFEIRTHMPDEPGTGYWWQDPTLDGWKPPSVTIWRERMSASPGVEWLRPAAYQGSAGIGLNGRHTFVVLEEHQVVGLNVSDGSNRWSLTPEDRIEEAMLDEVQPLLYVADQLGRVEAFHLPEDPGEDSNSASDIELASAWKLDLDVVGRPEMIPLPHGGLVLVVWDNMIGLSSSGGVLWQVEEFDRTLDWAHAGGRVILSTVGGDHSLWTIDDSGPLPWEGLSSGRLAGHGDDAFLYNDSGLFRLDPADGSSELLSDWPQDRLRAGDVLAMPDGQVLLAHASRSDRRLILFDEQGAMLWQRALPDTTTGTPSLLMASGQPYLVIREHSGISQTVSVFAIDTEAITLTRLFDGGTRTPVPRYDSVHPVGGERLLINIGGGHLVALDLNTAAESVASAIRWLPQ